MTQAKTSKDEYEENQLVKENIGLVVKIVKKFKPRDYSQYEELYSCGLFGLLKAIRTYDDKKGKLSTYAWKIIVREIVHYLNKENGHIVMNLDIKTIEKEQIQEYLPELSDDEALIIKLRCQGLTLKEISKLIKCSTTSTHNKLKAIQEKIKKSNNE